MLLAFFGGIYNNYLALEATIADARRHGAGALYCLGDLGAFGPDPDRVFPLLRGVAALARVRASLDPSLCYGNCRYRR